jgi:hypothetical protein
VVLNQGLKERAKRKALYPQAQAIGLLRIITVYLYGRV